MKIRDHVLLATALLGMASAVVIGVALAMTAEPADAQVKISALPSAATLTGAEQIPMVQAGGDVIATPAALATYIESVLGALPTISGAPTAGHCVEWTSATAIEDAGAACGSGGGGSTSPGGSSGQLQYNNAGAFGGFTLSGDCTFSAPSITCTKTSGVSFGTAATYAASAFDAAGAASAALASAEAYSANAGNLASGTVATGLLTGSYTGITGVGTLAAGSIPASLVTGLGTFAGQNYATPPAIGGTTPAAGSFSSLTDTGITGSTQCLQVNSSGLLSGYGAACGGSGVPANLTLTAPASATTLTLASGSTLTTTGAYADTLTFPGAYTYTFPAASGTVMTTSSPGSITARMVIGSGAYLAAGNGAPTIITYVAPTSPSAGLGSTTAVTYSAGSAAFVLTIGGTGITSTGTVTMSSAGVAHGWLCDGEDLTTTSEVVSTTGSLSTSSVTLTFFSRTTGAATAPTSGDLVGVKCTGV